MREDSEHKTFIYLVSPNETESHHGVESDGTTGQTIDILTVMYPVGLVSVANCISMAAAAHQPFADVICMAALGPAISQVTRHIFDPCQKIYYPVCGACSIILMSFSEDHKLLPAILFVFSFFHLFFFFWSHFSQTYFTECTEFIFMPVHSLQSYE